MSKKLNIGFDLDNTLINFPIIKEICKEYGDPRFNQYTKRDWYCSNFPPKLKQKIHKMYRSTKYMCDIVKPFKGSGKLIRDLKKLGHNVFIITARTQEIRHRTKEIVAQFFPDIDELHFVDVTGSKKALMKSLNLDYWIDDAPHEIKHAIDLGIKCIMVSNRCTPYNHEEKNNGEVECIKRVSELKMNRFR